MWKRNATPVCKYVLVWRIGDVLTCIYVSQLLQRLAYKYYPESLSDFALSSVGAVGTPDRLRAHVSAMTTEQLTDLCTRLQLLGKPSTAPAGSEAAPSSQPSRHLLEGEYLAASPLYSLSSSHSYVSPQRSSSQHTPSRRTSWMTSTHCRCTLQSHYCGMTPCSRYPSFTLDLCWRCPS